MADAALTRLQFLASAVGAERLTRVLDIGANPLDKPAYTPLLNAGLCHLWGFEPQREAYEKLNAQKSENETYFPHAVGAGGEEVLNIYAGSGFTSLKRIAASSAAFLQYGRATRTVAEETMTTHRLDDIADLPDPDLLKIDIQGGEVDVFQSGADRLKSAVAVIPEVRFYRLYEDEPMFAGIDQKLRSMGFVLHKFLAIKSVVISNSKKSALRPRQTNSQLVDGDAVYIKNLEEPDNLSTEQFRHLALLADSVFQSYDLVIHCLDQLVARGVMRPRKIDRYLSMLPAHVLREGAA